jgi:hypothetical protein
MTNEEYINYVNQQSTCYVPTYYSCASYAYPACAVPTAYPSCIPKKDELSKFIGKIVMYKNKKWNCYASANKRVSLQRKTFFLRRNIYDTASPHELRIIK